MADNLHQAKVFAKSIRFAGDCHDAREDISMGLPDRIKSHFYGNDLSLSQEVTPDLYCSLARVLDRLSIHPDLVEAFVYASPDINAQCCSSQDAECIIRFSSALVDILAFEEFEFVVGHELGHFLLSHSCMLAGGHEESVEHYMIKRAQELSADRIGLIACGSLDAAVKALIKTISGLSDEYLRFDVGKFLSQLDKLAESSHHSFASHPSILVRCKALLWFSTSTAYSQGSRQFSAPELQKLDQRIQKDLDRYVDGSARRMIESAKDNLSMWTATLDIVSDGKFTKEEQEKFGKKFGAEKLSKLILYLKDVPNNQVQGMVKEKVESSRRELQMLIPFSADKEIGKVDKESWQ